MKFSNSETEIAEFLNEYLQKNHENKQIAVASKGDKHIKLINKYGNRIHKEFCQDLNKRFAKSWKVKFV